MKTIKIIFLAALIASSQFTFSQTDSWKLSGNSLLGTEKFGSTNTQPVRFVTRNIQRMMIDTAGRLGIGTDFPGALLHVEKGFASIAAHPSSVIVAESSSDASISLLAPELKKTAILFATRVNGIVSQADGGIIYNDQSAARGLQFNTGGNSTRMVISGKGAVGIGTKTPSSELHIFHGDGNTAGLRLENKTSGGRSWNVFNFSNGDLGLAANGFNKGFFSSSSGAYFTLSDVRAKKDIEQAPEVLEKVMRLEVKKYHFLESKASDKKHYGMIAQEVEKLFPEIVTAPSASGSDRYAVNYNAYGVIAIKAIQEQQKLIEKQRSDIEELKAIINDLKERIEQMSQTNHTSGKASIQNSKVIELTGATLKQNAPNPFNAVTTINYYLPEIKGSAAIDIISPNGQIIKTHTLTQRGNGQLSIKAGELATGIYHYVLRIDGVKVDSKQMVLVK